MSFSIVGWQFAISVRGVPARPRTRTQMQRKRTPGLRVHTENPFQEPESTDVYGQQEAATEKRKQDWSTFKHTSIGNRTLLGAPETSHRALRARYEYEMSQEKAALDGEVKPFSELRQRQQHADRLIQEEREVFLSNLLISRQEKEISRIHVQKQAKELKLEVVIMENREIHKHANMTTDQWERMLSRVKAKLEEQVRGRVAIESAVKLKTHAIGTTEAEITWLQEALTEYRAYAGFMRDIESACGKQPETTADLVDRGFLMSFNVSVWDEVYELANYSTSR